MNKDFVTVPTLPSEEVVRFMVESYERLEKMERIFLSGNLPKVGDVIVIPRIENLR